MKLKEQVLGAQHLAVMKPHNQKTAKCRQGKKRYIPFTG